MPLIFGILTVVAVLGLGYAFSSSKGWVTILGVLGGLLAAVMAYFNFTQGMFVVQSWLDYTMPVFWTALWIVFLLVVADVIGSLSSYSSNGSFAGSILSACLAAVLLLFAMGAELNFNPHPSKPFCQEQWMNELVNTFNITLTEPFSYPDVDPNRSIITDEDLAKNMVSDVSGDFSTYLRVGNAQHIEVNGQPQIVIDLVPLSYAGYNQHGGVIEGFYTVDPIDENAEAIFHPIPIALVPSLEESRNFLPLTIDNDLERRVFNEITGPNGWKALDLNTLEMDDQGQPRYTALLVEPLVGNVGYLPVAFVIIDPTQATHESGAPWYTIYQIPRSQNEQGAYVFDVSAIPTWVNNVFPLEYIRWMTGLWGEHKFHTLCLDGGGTSDQFVFDRIEDKILANGHRVYMMTMTSNNADSGMSMRLYADPRTGSVIGFRTVGAYALQTLVSVEETFRAETRNEFPPYGYTPSETEITEWSGYQVITTLLKSEIQSENGQVESRYEGFGVVLADNTYLRDSNNFIVADTPQEAYRLFMTQMAESPDPEINRGAEVTYLTVHGLVTAVGQPYFDGEVSRISFQVTTAEGIVYTFSANADGYTTLLAIGHEVIVSVSQIEQDVLNQAAFNNVDQLVNVTLHLSPPLDLTPEVTAEPSGQ